MGQIAPRLGPIRGTDGLDPNPTYLTSEVTTDDCIVVYYIICNDILLHLAFTATCFKVLPMLDKCHEQLLRHDLQYLLCQIMANAYCNGISCKSSM